MMRITASCCNIGSGPKTLMHAAFGCAKPGGECTPGRQGKQRAFPLYFSLFASFCFFDPDTKELPAKKKRRGWPAALVIPMRGVT